MARRILEAWRWTQKVPGIGGWLFSLLVRRMSPYSASIFPQVEDLSAGFCRVSIEERRALKNPFESIHAIALANLGELASGLAFLTTIPPEKRGIVTGFHVDYYKKARGRIVAECRTKYPEQDGLCTVTVGLVDESGAEVARTTATWSLGPQKGKG